MYCKWYVDFMKLKIIALVYFVVFCALSFFVPCEVTTYLTSKYTVDAFAFMPITTQGDRSFAALDAYSKQIVLNSCKNYNTLIRNDSQILIKVKSDIVSRELKYFSLASASSPSSSASARGATVGGEDNIKKPLDNMGFIQYNDLETNPLRKR